MKFINPVHKDGKDTDCPGCGHEIHLNIPIEPTKTKWHPTYAREVIGLLKGDLLKNEKEIRNLEVRNEYLRMLIANACENGGMHNESAFHTGPGNFCKNCDQEM